MPDRRPHPSTSEPPTPPERTPRLDVLKTLGDNTRYAIYLELARSPRPLSTSEIAETLDLHPNTVRPHLERMREAGLVAVQADGRGSVGRPQHRYSLAAEAPALGLEPPTFPLLAQLLAATAWAAGAEADDALEIGREQGKADARGAGEPPCLDRVLARLDELGFDPTVAADEDVATVAFTHCPFADLARAYPELVCQLHRGIVQGMVEELGGQVTHFRTLVDRDPCQVDLVSR